MHVIRTTLVLLLAGASLPAAAQSFNLRHDLEGSVNNSGTGWAVEVTDDGNYLVVCNGNYVSGTVSLGSVVRALVIDAKGSILAEERVPDSLRSTYPGWSNSMAKRVDGGFVAGGNTLHTDSVGNLIRRATLFMVAPNGSMEGLTEVGPDNQSWIGRQAKQTTDGGYVICGEVVPPGATHSDAFVIKTDVQGNEEWIQTYGGPWNDFAMSIDCHSGTNYFVGGQRFIGSNKQHWVQCLNDTGGVEWSKVWGSAFGEPNAHLTLASDGSPLVASGWGYASNDQSRKYLAKLDPTDGAIVWEREYGSICACPLFVVKEVTPGGDLISAGQNYVFPESYGTLLRTTSTGDSLWMRHYQYSDSLVSNGRGVFRDVVPTPDGGFIAVGSAYSVSGIYTQDVWVVKVDSMGCLEPGCHLITGMETQITNLVGALKVWPNPVAAGSPVQVEVQLPEGFVMQGQLRLTVTDAVGRLLNEQQLRGPAGQLTTDNWQPGVHHLHLHDNTRWIAGAKLVVQ